MFFNKKKKKLKDDRVRLTVSERTIDSKEFIIPQIANQEEGKSTYTKSRFISPIFGSKAKDEIVVPDMPRQTGDHDLKYDRFRTTPKLTKEDMIERFGSEYHEFDMVSGSNLSEALDRQNKLTKHHLDKEDPEVYIPSKKEIEEASTEHEVPDFLMPDTDADFVDKTREKTSINDFFEDNKEEDMDEYEFDEKDDDELEEENEEEENEEEEKQIKVQRKQINDGYVLPPFSLLTTPPQKEADSGDWIQKQIQVLNRTFEEFGVGAAVYRYTKGPTVTRYEIALDRGVNVKKITSISDNLKMALAAKEIRIEAPIPGKTTVGIEVPNLKPEMVYFLSIVDTDEFKNHKDPLAVGLGLDIDGKAVYTSIRSMPHGLVAGATGSGKSVCINTILISLLFKYKPEELKLMLIDPKMVELSAYNDLPHLLTPVITDVKVATAALKWAVEEMERRFLVFKDERVRDIKSYNQKMIGEGNLDIMPFVVIIIDELADLMTVASSSVEEAIMRLTQKARACGMHMIIATQRPSTDVIKGTIKSNIPTRVAFMVSSYIDSMTIIDSAGADKLLGKGDMLFAESGKPNFRLQGAYISDKEIYAVTDFIRNQRESDYLFTQERLIQKATISVDGDELTEEVARYVVLMEECSINKISKEFKIGFNRAQKIVELLSGMGVVSDNLGSKARTVLVDSDGLAKILE
jgi:S-DNA-T family DNA segregation ATPase FtsK/SpoIIIE